MEVTEYINTLAQEGGWDEDSRKAVLKAIGENPKAAEMFKRDVMARQDYSKNMDTLKTDKDAFEVSKTEQKTKETQWLKFYEDLKAIEAQQQAAGGGDDPIDSVDPQVTPDDKPLTRKEMSDYLAKRDDAYVSLLETTVNLQNSHQATFGEALPVTEVKKFAAEHQLPLQQAYDKFIEPRLIKKREDDLVASKKASYEEGVLKGRSEQQSPPDAGTTGGSEFLQNVRSTEGDKPDGLAAFTEGWHEAAAKASP
ncbi:hypothetical protein LCGC14_1213860 [marine sediment metagenome]|uniref:Uncharacterized protein n=1 Tax=marine sediment metagenome TaxID=412755 RepID=A0A0F9PHW8_9ZZZZ